MCTTHKHKWLSFSSWSILQHPLPSQQKERNNKKKDVPTLRSQNKTLFYRIRFGNHWMTMGWPWFSDVGQRNGAFNRGCTGPTATPVGWWPFVTYVGFWRGSEGLKGTTHARWAQHHISSLPLCSKGSLLTTEAMWHKVPRWEGLKNTESCRIC